MKTFSTIKLLTVCALIAPVLLLAQHRGDNLAFQGFFHQTESSVKAMAMGGTFLATTGEVTSIFYNPAGLTAIQGLTFSISATSHSQLWRENQNYRPNRMFWTMPFYLEGLYIPDPAENGIDDYLRAQDTNYVVQEPVTGLEPYSEEAADWQKQLDKLGLNNIVVAYPLAVAGQSFVLSAGYRYNQILDFDRNDTYLDPHIGFDEYGVMERVVTGVDTFSWSRFTRDRSGDLTSINGAIAYDLNENFKFGAGFTYLTGQSDDYQALERVGTFEIERNNVFRFSYDTVNTFVSGSSDYNAIQFDLGAIFSFKNINFALTYKLPYTMTREWRYDTVSIDSTGQNNSSANGKDEMDVPGTFSAGVRFTPINWFIFAVDYQYTPYSKTEFTYDWQNDTQRSYADQHSYRFGTEFRVHDYVSLMAGYRDIPALFVPDGAAIKESGPSAKGYTFGTSIFLNKFGRIDIAYEHRMLKYYDSYFSNTNYVTESMNAWAVAYTLSL